MNKNDAIYIAGHQGMVGSALFRQLQQEGYKNLIFKSFSELDLRNQHHVHTFFAQKKPQYVFLAAAKVGGILANNTYPAEFIYDNLMITTNIIHASYLTGVKKLLFLGSSCIYPRLAQQPIKEEYLLTGPLEKTNEPYALAKIASIGLCQAYNRQYGTRFISCMPTNLYGPRDSFDLNTCHVLPALLKKIYTAHHHNDSFCVVWGSGTPLREFLFVDDLAQALIFLMNNYENSEPVNVGSGHEVSIKEVAEIICDIIGYKGTLIFDATKPDGTPRKLLDCSKLTNLGWHATTSLAEGLKRTLAWCIENGIFVSPSVASIILAHKTWQGGV